MHKTHTSRRIAVLALSLSILGYATLAQAAENFKMVQEHSGENLSALSPPKSKPSKD